MVVTESGYVTSDNEVGWSYLRAAWVKFFCVGKLNYVDWRINASLVSDDNKKEVT